jgi:hypothetical protein
MTPQDRLLAVAIRALQWFDRHSRGLPQRGMYEDLEIGRDLYDAIADVEAERQRQQQISLEELEARR